jgi:hypothetical protein
MEISFLNSYNKGTEFISSKVVQRTIVGGFWFNQKWNLSKGSQETFSGLEMADLIATRKGESYIREYIEQIYVDKFASINEKKIIHYCIIVINGLAKVNRRSTSGLAASISGLWKYL